MTVQEVMLKAISGELHWFRAAEILGWSPRTLRRWRERYEADGYAGLVDKRLLRPSNRRVPAGEVERVLGLYRERYAGFNVRHFHQIVKREHAVTVSYSFVKQTLQQGGLVKKYRARGRHRRRREPRACFGEMLHLDGSVHPWLALAPDERPCLILVSDDATKRVLAATFFPAESTLAVMTSLATVLRTEGLPMALYTDRAGWAFYTPKAKGPVDKTRLTQVGRALSRRATLRYRDAFLNAREELVAEVEGFAPSLLASDAAARATLPERTQFLLRVHQHLATIKKMEFAPVISWSNNDPGEWKEWTDAAKVEVRVTRFKKPLFHSDPEKCDPLAILIVKSMLLTGFDAPVEQALYLDRFMHEHELLQAIARVNRTATKKSAGLVVDYFGIAKHLKEALAAYSAEDVEGALQSLKDEIPKLRDRHRRVVSVFTDQGIEDIEDTEVCVELLRDERLRVEFNVKLKLFLSTLDLVLPRPEALPFVKDAKTLAFIQTRARNLYRTGGGPIGKEVGEKVRALIDEHVIALGINPTIAPISIMDAEFSRHVDKQASPRAKASEMEHALRFHIRKHYDEDPEHFDRLSERLAKILTDLKDRWDELVQALRTFVTEVEAGRQQDTTGLDPETQAPFLGILRQEMAIGAELPPDRLLAHCQLTVELVEHIQQEIRLVGFWQNAHAQIVLRKWVFQYLDANDVLPIERLQEVADRIVELAKANHGKLTR